jgi:hypothetical protein
MDNVGAFLTSNGRSFHNCGAEIEKALSPYEVVRDLGTLRLYQWMLIVVHEVVHVEQANHLNKKGLDHLQFCM